MKKNIMIFLVALVIGTCIAGVIFYKSFSSKEVKEDLVGRAFQIGVYSNYSNALKIAERNNGIVIKDNDFYRVYVSVLKDDEAIKRLESYYKEIGLKYYLKDINVSREFLDNIVEDEELIKNSSSETYTTINTDVLMKYEDSHK